MNDRETARVQRQWEGLTMAFLFGVPCGFAIAGDCLIWLVRIRAVEIHMGPRLMTVSALLILFANLGAFIGFIVGITFRWRTRPRHTVAL